MCASRVGLPQCLGGGWRVKELKHSIFTRCHSHSAGIINTQTHSHTYLRACAACVRGRGCAHADTRSAKRGNHCGAQVSRSLLESRG